MLQHFIEVDILLLGLLFQRIDAFGTDAPLGNIEHSTDRQRLPQLFVIIRLLWRQQTQIAQRILDLRPFIETDAAIDAVRDVCIQQRLFQCTGKIVGTIEHRHVPIAHTAVVERLQPGGDPHRFVLLIRRREMNDLRIAVAAGIQVFLDAVLIVLDDGVGALEDVFLAAVILVEDHRPAVREILFKFQDDVHPGPAPRIDRLIGITDDAQLRIRCAQQPDDRILQLVHILKLIDMEIGKTALPLCAHLFALLQQPVCKQQQIIEIQRIHVRQPLLIGRIDIGTDPLSFQVCHLLCLLHRDERRLAGRDVADHGRIGKHLGVHILFLVNFLEDALLILAVQDRKVARIAELPDILAQQAYTKGVDRRDLHAVCHRSQYALYPLLHLSGRFIRKCDR